MKSGKLRFGQRHADPTVKVSYICPRCGEGHPVADCPQPAPTNRSSTV